MWPLVSVNLNPSPIVPYKAHSTVLYLVLSLHALSVLLEVELERLDVVVEAEGGHGEEDVLAVDRLPLLSLASEMDRIYSGISLDQQFYIHQIQFISHDRTQA